MTPTNIQADKDLLWKLYREFVTLENRVCLELMNLSAVDDRFQQLKGQRDAYREASTLMLKRFNYPC